MTTVRYKAGEIRHYNFTAQDKLFLDANIWLYLYGPPKPKRSSQQRGAFAALTVSGR